MTLPMSLRSCYELPGSARQVLDAVETFENWTKRHPVKKETSKSGQEVYYVRYDEIWLSAGITEGAADWSCRQAWGWWRKRLDGVVWC